MQLALTLDEFNIFIMIYLKSVTSQDVDHKKGLLQMINDSKNPEAILLYKEREQGLSEEKWSFDQEKTFNTQIKQMIPSINIHLTGEFDDFADILSGRNMDSWLRQRYYRQSPKMRLYLKRFIDKLESNDDITVRLIV